MKSIFNLRNVLLAILSLIVIVIFSMWLVNKYNNEKMYEEGIAQIFDESMEASYPLLAQAANVYYDRYKQLEMNAKQANEMSRNIKEFQEEFVRLNRKSSILQSKKFDDDYSLFITSLAGGRLYNGSKLRKKASQAFLKIEWSRNALKNWDEMEPDSIVKICHKVQVALSTAILDLDEYRKPSQDINAWRYIGPEDSYELHQKYYARKNWPFTIFKSKK